MVNRIKKVIVFLLIYITALTSCKPNSKSTPNINKDTEVIEILELKSINDKSDLLTQIFAEEISEINNVGSSYNFLLTEYDINHDNNIDYFVSLISPVYNGSAGKPIYIVSK